MINITNKQSCCGCGACVQKCPKQCISLKEDNEGFLYPQVDTETCIDCGLCEKVCPVLNPYDARKPQQVFAAINKDENIRMESSSGGIFTLLAEKVINEGGVVFGARFDEEWQVTLDYTETIEGLAAFRGSKYVQARTGETYKQCEQFLKEGRKVLYTGTPCQIAGLHHFLRKEYDNLTTCDFVCHGVPSPKVWRKYLDEVIDGANRAINDIKFRNKDNGWKAFNFKMTYDEDSKSSTLSSCHKENLFMRAFLCDMILRPSCHDCKAKQGCSMSDLTIADYWGIQHSHPEMDDDKGTGLVLIHTVKGKESLDWKHLDYISTNIEDATPYNNGLKPSMPAHRNRTKFFSRLDEATSVQQLILDCTKPTVKQQIRFYLSIPRIVIRKLLKFVLGGVNSNVQNTTRPANYPTKPISKDYIRSVTFRDKRNGWKTYHIVITFNS